MDEIEKLEQEIAEKKKKLKEKRKKAREKLTMQLGSSVLKTTKVESKTEFEEQFEIVRKGQSQSENLGSVPENSKPLHTISEDDYAYFVKLKSNIENGRYLAYKDVYSEIAKRVQNWGKNEAKN